MKNFQAPNAITAAQGDPGGHIWGYVDPSWLPGFNPAVRKTTIEEILTPMYKNVWKELPAAEKLPVPPVIPPIYDQPHATGSGTRHVQCKISLDFGVPNAIVASRR